MDGATNSGLYDPSSIPLGEKKENKQKERPGLVNIKRVKFKCDPS